MVLSSSGRFHQFHALFTDQPELAWILHTYSPGNTNSQKRMLAPMTACNGDLFRNKWVATGKNNFRWFFVGTRFPRRGSLQSHRVTCDLRLGDFANGVPLRRRVRGSAQVYTPGEVT